MALPLAAMEEQSSEASFDATALRAHKVLIQQRIEQMQDEIETLRDAREIGPR